jgi:hypothetical protein
VASALNRRPPDLSTTARRNGGRFPTERVQRFVTGDREPTLAHGSAEIPVWGPIFRALDPQDRLTAFASKMWSRSSNPFKQSRRERPRQVEDAFQGAPM